MNSNPYHFCPKQTYENLEHFTSPINQSTTETSRLACLLIGHHGRTGEELYRIDRKCGRRLKDLFSDNGIAPFGDRFLL